MTHLTRLVLLLVGFSPMALEAQVIEHQGAINPTAEGWTEFMTGSVDVGPVVNDLGLGVDSWKVHDNDTNGNRFYFIEPSDAIVDAAFLYGWSLSTTIRIVDFPDPPDGQERALPEDGSPALHYRDGSREWNFHFGAEDNGDVIAMLITKALPAGQREGIPILVSGGSSEYRTFELVYDPVSGTADLFVDGTSAFVGYEGAPFDTSASVRWGASGTPSRGHANFASVRFDIGDQCPDDSDKTEPGICGCGIADIDTDADGVLDCDGDECPDDPNKTDPGICGCGIAETDSDADGTPDCVDECPTDPLKTVVGICGCGSLDADANGNGTLDCMDSGCGACGAFGMISWTMLLAGFVGLRAMSPRCGRRSRRPC